MADLSWNHEDIPIVLPVIITTVSFITYWIVIHSRSIKDVVTNNNSDNKSAIRYYLFQKLFGALILGLIPYIICKLFLPSESGNLRLWTKPTTEVLIWMLLSMCLTIPITYFNAKRPENFVKYPQLRITSWTYKTLMIYLGGWFIYIIGYEFLFRGVLFLPVVNSIGIWPAIALNIALYSIVHLLNSPREAIGSIPFAIVLCLVTLESNMLLPAIVIHLSISWTNAITSVKNNPEIDFPVRQ